MTVDETEALIAVSWGAIDDLTHTYPATAPNVIYYIAASDTVGGDESARLELDTSDFTLTIPEVREADERKYFCQVQANLPDHDSGISKVSSK